MPKHPNDPDIDAMLDACESLADQIEKYLGKLEAERPEALDSGDDNYLNRIERSIETSRQLLEHTDHTIDQIGHLRWVNNLLRWARQGIQA